MTTSLLDYRRPRRVPAELAPWRSCAACRLSLVRSTVVLGRGPFPADVAFIGIGPGRVEDRVGAAFVGTSGALLDEAVRRAGGGRLRLRFDNLVACHPTDRLRGPNRDPLPDEITACRERLSVSLSLARPRSVVVLGELARSETRSLCPDAVALHHPSYLHRCGGRGSVEFRTFVLELEEVFRGLEESKKCRNGTLR